MKTAIYVRVSTEEQAKEGFSIGAQKDKLQNYIKIMDWELCGIYIDEGISGKNITDRPDINRLIADIKKNKINNVLVFKIDRLTRSIRDLVSLMDLFQEYNCGFSSLTESIDTNTASGRMFIKIIGIFAEFERENLIERVSIGKEKKARDGYTNSSIAAYGYSRELGNRLITVNKEEAKIVKKIFSMYLKKHNTFEAIAKELNMRGIKSYSGREWIGKSIIYILSNPIYAGKVRHAVNDKDRYFEAQGKHDAIISEETFAKVQSKLAKMQVTRKKTPKDVNYYCGTLKCGICGEKMTTHGHYLKDKEGNDVYYCSYVCSARYNNKCTCNASTISHRKVDKGFIKYISNIKDFTIEKDMEINVDEESQEDTATLKAEYETRLTKLLKKEKDIMTLYISDKIAFSEYNKMVELIKKDIQAYEDKISELDSDRNVSVELNMKDIIINLRENWELLTDAERMQFLQTNVNSIYVVNEQSETGARWTAKVKKIEFYKG